MSTPSIRRRLELLLGGDQELYAQLHEAGLLPPDDETLAPEHLETARVVRVLVRELEVNWAGVEVILQMRQQLVATRRQLEEIATVLRKLQGEERDQR